MKHCIIFITIVLIAADLFAQRALDADLQQRLAGKTKFYDIKATVNDYYDEKIRALSLADSSRKKMVLREAKFWNRHFYEGESRLNDDGVVANVTQKIVDYLSTSHAASSLTTAYGNWSHIGPDNVASGIGRINRIAFHPSNSSVAYAGSAAGGLYKTTNEGISWANVGSFIPSLGISGIVVSHNNAEEVYVLTGDGDANNGGFNQDYGYIRYSVGVLKSRDGGATWNRTGTFPGLETERYTAFQLAQDPNNANTLLAATSKGLFKTTDGGDTWQLCILDGAGSDGKRVYDVKYKPGNSTTVYCTFRVSDTDGNSCEFAISSNGGDVFLRSGSTFSPSITNATRIVIGVTPANPSYVYLLCGPGYVTAESTSNDTFEGLYRSTNSGATFARRSNSPDILAYVDIINTFPNQSTYDLALAVSPTNANTIIAGGLVVWRSTDGGINWSEIVDYFEDTDNSNYIHSDVHHLAYNPINTRLFACTDGGVAVSSDNGSNWSRRFNGLGCTQFYHFEPANEDGDIWGGTQDNGVMIREGSTSTFDEFDGGDGYDVLTDKSPAGNNNDKYWVINTSIWADGIADVDVTPGDITKSTANFFPNLAMCPTNEDILFAGYPILYVSYDRGTDWSYFTHAVGSKIPGNWSISTCPTNQRRVYTAGKGEMTGMFRIDNLLNVTPYTVMSLSGNLQNASNGGYPSTNPKITDIAVSPNGSNRVWVTVGGFNNNSKVFYSGSSGDNWTNISGNLPNLPVNTITVDANDNVYIGTDIGVYYKGFNDADWTPFYNKLPRVPVSELELYTVVGGLTYLYAATYGRGIWYTEVFSACVADLSVTSTLQGQRFYQASNITSTSTVSGGAGTNVFFRAATQVTLQEGIVVTPGSELNVFIAPCNSGPVSFSALIGDSIVNLTRHSEAARELGFVDNVTKSGNIATAIFKISSPGDYIVRVYDIESGKYLSSLPVTFSSGMVNKDITLETNWSKYLRVDLFKDNTLVHYYDFEK